MSNLVRSSLQEVNEVPLGENIYTLSVPASSTEVVETLEHGFGRTPYYTYDISLDGTNYIAPPYFSSYAETYVGDAEFSFLYAFMYTDATNLYFNYLFTGEDDPPDADLVVYIRYRVYLTENFKQ